MSLQIEEKDVDPKLAEQIEHPHHVPLRIMDSFHREPDFEGWVKGFATKHAVSVFLPNEIRKLTKAILTTEVGESLPAASEQFRYRIVEVGDEAFILGDMEQDNCALPRGSIEAGYSDSETIYRKKVHVAEPGYVLSSKVKRQTMEKGFLCMDTEGDWIDDAKKAESVTDEQFSFYALNKNESS